jgi:hypothetical protein
LPCAAPPATINRLFSHALHKEKAGRDGPNRLIPGETVMLQHRNLLPMILVKIGVKVKITIVRK